MRHLRNNWKPLLALFAILLAFGLYFATGGRNGLDFNLDSSAEAQEVLRQRYDLTDLRVMSRVILQVKNHYVDPDRINARRMLLGGLNAVQRTVAPVLVHYDEGENALTVQVDNQERRFRVDDVNSPWSLTYRFREVFAFLQSNLQGEDIELRDIEYAAVNGMLRTLDPHSVLLTPEIYEEMRMNTRGEFGGLGIVISIRDGRLTVIRPMEGTPAYEAGIRRMDRIVKINDESTLNMPLSEAVDRLRGAPGSAVSVWVTRDGADGWREPRRFQIHRAVIHIVSIESRMLAGNVGYIRIKSFQGNTHDDMRQALRELRRDGMEGLVLDLRDDPGGLLEQAVRVADTFLSSGTIVTTSSNDPRQRDEKFARQSGTEPNYPMICLVNGGSASASEIVAGALKNHDRALIVGQRTFGKGSVQVLYDYEDGSALKLTIAQYLTPGDVSIQGVGITPDIAIDPMTVDRRDMDLAVNRTYIRESDLASHLTNDRARETEQPSLVLQYYLPKAARERLREAGPEASGENRNEEEFLLRFSQRLLARGVAGRRHMLRRSEPVLDEVRREELAQAVTALRELGVDWSEGSDEGGTTLAVEASTSASGNRGKAGESLDLRVRVTNTGSAPVYRLRAVTHSDFGLFDGRELVFGHLMPGQTREWSTTLGTCERERNAQVCRLPRHLPDRADGIRVEFAEAHGHAPEPVEIRTEIESLPRPRFSYQVHVADNLSGNGDGKLQKGERLSVFLHVRNTGRGRTYDTQANLRNLSGRGVLLRAGRFSLDSLNPGDERTVAFTFEVLPDFDKDVAKLELSLSDQDLREAVTERLEIPVASSGTAPTARRGRVVLREGAPIRATPAPDGAVVAHIRSGSLALPAQAALDGFVRVEMDENRPAWVANQDIISGRPSRGARLEEDLNHMPPEVFVDMPTLVTRSQTVSIEGRATDERLVRDVYVYIGARKAFYHSNRGSEHPRETRFSTQVALRPGTNYITVVARENDRSMSRRSFVVRRDSQSGALLETPKHADEWFTMGIDHN